MADDLNGFVEQVGADIGGLRNTIAVDIPLEPSWRTDVQTDLKAYRSGNTVTVSAWRLAATASITGDVVAYVLPEGYRPPPLFVDRTLDSRDATVKLGASNTVTITNPSTSVSHHSFTFVTLDAPLTQ